MWQFLTDTWDYYTFEFYFFGVLVVLLPVGSLVYARVKLKWGWKDVLIALVIVSFGTSMGASIAFGGAYRRWMKTWQGRVVRKYTYETYFHGGLRMTGYALELKNPVGTGAKVSLPESEWERIIVGHCVVKKKYSYRVARGIKGIGSRIH